VYRLDQEMEYFLFPKFDFTPIVTERLLYIEEDTKKIFSRILPKMTNHLTHIMG
jgi:hypothetical protein